MSVAGIGGAARLRDQARTGVYNGPSAAQQNPLGQAPYFFHRLLQLVAARRMDVTQTERTLAAGFFRRWIMRTANAGGTPPGFSWARDSFYGDGPVTAMVSAPRRYLTGNVSTLDGNLLSDPKAREVVPFVRSAGQPPLVVAGQTPLRPTVRNRLTSFGSRVPPINKALPSEDVTNG